MKYSAFSWIPKCLSNRGPEHMLKYNTIRVERAFKISPIELLLKLNSSLGDCLLYHINSGAAQWKDGITAD